jgi:hypothetical protein
MTTTEQLQRAFALGFMVTCEGFNGECDYDHLAPQQLEPYMGRDTVEQFMAYIVTNEEFVRLRDLAVAGLVASEQ